MLGSGKDNKHDPLAQEHSVSIEPYYPSYRMNGDNHGGNKERGKICSAVTHLFDTKNERQFKDVINFFSRDDINNNRGMIAQSLEITSAQL